MKNTDFLEKLNSRQRQAVDKIYGTVLVLAGPGTGKTQMLTCRIANILQQTDTNPSNILCLTFTENGATQMRNRLQKWIGTEAYKVNIFTFHGFCENIMNWYPEIFLDQKGEKEIADDLKKALIFRSVIDRKAWKKFRPFGDNYNWQYCFLKAVSDLKRENVSLERLKEMIPVEKERLEENPENIYKKDSKFGKKGEFKPTAREKINDKMEKLEEFCELWKAYEAEMTKQKAYDFDDQIAWVVNKIATNQNLKSDLQERFQFVLVDEYQDTNSAQNAILWHLADFFDDPNLFVVGDDDQSVFRFQGASIQNILEFKEKFPKAEIVNLVDNYRSGQKILDTAYAVIKNNLERVDLDKELKAAKDIEVKIEKAIYTSRFSELISLAEKIQEQIKEGISPGEIAIFARENKEVKEIASILQKLKIPVSTRVFENIFEDANVKFLILMLKIFENPTLDHEFLELLHAPFWQISAKTLFQASLEARQDRKGIASILQKHAKDSPELERIISLFVEGRKNYYHLPAYIIAEKLFHDSGQAQFLSEKKNENRISDLLKIRKLVEWMERHTQDSLSEVLKKIDLHAELKIAIAPDPLPLDKHSVQVMTVHKAKGSEFEVVFLPGLLDKTWGNRKTQTKIPLPELSDNDHDENEEERRLFFVALTRAKKNLFLSFAEKDFSGRDRTPSQFWHEVPDNLCEIFSPDQLEERAQELLPIFFETESPQFTRDESDILHKLTQKFVWSATSLQNFIDCPRKFLYVNLLRIPLPPKKYFGYGSALHRALETFCKYFAKTGKLSEELLLAEFEKSLKTQNLTLLEFKESLAHGKEILQQYFMANKDKFSQNTLLEFDFGRNSQIDGIPATGKIDKIELSDDKKQAVFVDYKSGSMKSVKKGERLWRQLVFYNLLAQHNKLDFTVEKFELEFLTPDNKGIFVRKGVEIGEEDRKQVLEELKEANKKIQNLEFSLLPNTEGDEEINYWQNFGK